jgi:hypothetical protein
MLEESLGLLSIPVNGVGLLICSLFWTGMYYLCIGLSRTLAPKVYSGLSAEDRIHWNNYAWSATHGVIGFLVRLPSLRLLLFSISSDSRSDDVTCFLGTGLRALADLLPAFFLVFPTATSIRHHFSVSTFN